MKAVVFSGTTEGRVFSRQLAALGAAVLVSVATPLGAEEQGEADGITVHCGRLTPEEMTALLQGAALCVDAACSGPKARCPPGAWCLPPQPTRLRFWPDAVAMCY